MFKILDWFFIRIFGLNTTYEKIIHQNDIGYDLKVSYWVYVKNPRWVGNFFQCRGWYETRQRIIKNAHQKIV